MMFFMIIGPFSLVRANLYQWAEVISSRQALHSALRTVPPEPLSEQVLLPMLQQVPVPADSREQPGRLYIPAR
jgi:hypothetical protein